MHPLRERTCDELLEHPLLRTPPPEPEKPRPPRVRKPRVFKLPPRFPLLSKQFYANWCNHQKELQMARHIVDDSPPELFPELYLKPRRLDFYAMQLEQTMNVNKELLKRINVIQRTGGFVDCWMPELSNNYNKLLCKQRQRQLNEIQKNNLYFYNRLLVARSEQYLTKELDALWKDTKHKLILGASLPFILFKTGKIDQDIKDPAFDKPPNVNRTKNDLLEAEYIAGASLKQIAHYGQNIRDKLFRRYHHGVNNNMEIYGLEEPPLYDIGVITVDTTMHYTVNDDLLDERDVLAMAADMPNTKVRKVARETFLHSDFVAALDAKELVTDYIIEALLNTPDTADETTTGGIEVIVVDQTTEASVATTENSNDPNVGASDTENADNSAINTVMNIYLLVLSLLLLYK